MRTFRLILILIFTIFLTSCSGKVNAPSEPPKPNPDVNEPEENSNENSEEEEEVGAEEVAIHLVELIKEKDWITLSTFIDPVEGVRFTPYGYINPAEDRVFTSSEIRGIEGDQTVYQWGYFDGSGEPINLTFSDYYNQFVFDQDYLNAEKISINERLGHGNSIDNSKVVYPGATVIEFYFSGFDQQYNGMDWKSLRLVLQQKDNKWLLIGIIHDQWTI